MQDPKDEPNKDKSVPSFDDPADPRWSQNPHAFPSNSPAGQQGAGTHPYADQPLYAPPGSTQNPYPGQPPYPGPGVGSPGQYQQHQYPQPGYHPRTMEKSNVFGIISLVMGIVGLMTFGAMLVPQLAAVVCGHVSLHREKPRRGFAMAGLIMGYVSLGLGALMFLGLLAVAAGGAAFSV